MPQELRRKKVQPKVRFVTATTLFDGHDASINVFRRLLQRAGAEVIHLGQFHHGKTDGHGGGSGPEGIQREF
jgi:methylmalonyl-CoA mutase cobalamin-binding subunit